MVERTLFVTSCLLVASEALTWDFSVTDVSCQDSLPVTLDFSWMCSDDSICTFGNEDATVAGEVTYNGLQGMVGASALDFLYVDANLYISSSVDNEPYTQQILDMYEIPVCWTDDGCPTDGSYTFSTKIRFPDVSNEMAELWDTMNTETNTTIAVEMYYNDSSIVVGRCVMAIAPQASDMFYDDQPSLKDKLFRQMQSRDFITTAVLLTCSIFLVCCFLSLRSHRTLEDARKKEPLIVTKKKDAKGVPTIERRPPLIQARVAPNKLGHGVSYEETPNGTILIVSNNNATQRAGSDDESARYIRHQTTSESGLFNASLTFSDGDATRSSSIDDDETNLSSLSADGCNCMTLYEPPLEHLAPGKLPKRKGNR